MTGPVSTELRAEMTPAYYELLAVVTAIAERDGDERALAWVEAAMALDFSAFVNVVVAAPKPPMLRLVHSAT